jgi:hypothetical protein
MPSNLTVIVAILIDPTAMAVIDQVELPTMFIISHILEQNSNKHKSK